MVMTSRPPPATNRTRSRPSVSTSRKSMSARHLLRNARNFWQHATTLKLTKQQSNFYRAMRYRHKRGLCCHAVSVRLSVTFVSCAKTNKDIFEIYPPSGSDTILLFPYQRGCRYSDGNPTGASNARGYDKMTIYSQISRSISETVIVRWVHATRQFVSIKFSFHPYNI